MRLAGTGKIQCKAAMFWLLVIGVALRSLIAPGLMLNPAADTPLGFGITFCEGFEDIDSQEFFADPHTTHSHNDTSHGHEHPGSSKHEHDLSGHGCGLWNVSSLYVHALYFNFEHSNYVGPDLFHTDYRTPFGRESYQKPQQARAPPRTLLI